MTQYLEKHAAHDDKDAALTKLGKEKAVLQKELQASRAHWVVLSISSLSSSLFFVVGLDSATQ